MQHQERSITAVWSCLPIKHLCECKNYESTCAYFLILRNSVKMDLKTILQWNWTLTFYWPLLYVMQNILAYEQCLYYSAYRIQISLIPPIISNKLPVWPPSSGTFSDTHQGTVQGTEDVLYLAPRAPAIIGLTPLLPPVISRYHLTWVSLLLPFLLLQLVWHWQA